MQEKNISPQESLQVIQSMIAKTRENLAANAYYFLLWGWLVFSATLLHYCLLQFTRFEYPQLAWNLMWVGGVASIIHGVKSSRKEKVKTFISESMKYFGISLGIIFASLVFIFGYYKIWQFAFPVYILIYAAACFFMGALMQFRYLMIAGLICLPIMAVSVFVNFKGQLLLLALAVFIAYIIPGHILKARKFK